ncbi:MAG: PaaX family transcriptional regulator, phenylacetic acid degradation operon negative regulatory [Candidatus Kaiserbacteria bacterium]|nr:PaaX family transcriptional regulator, phenylacetic acid degradation operon negative regulatory [Candidatus Kaiserbacteria bacterium]
MMGVIEQGVKLRARRGQIQHLVLAGIQTAGMLAVLAVAPNVIGAMTKLGLIQSSRQKDIVYKTSSRLVKSGALTWKNGYLTITVKGEALLYKLKLIEYKNKRPKHWDHKWRLLMFDIPEHRKKLRDHIRQTLQTIGFVHLQHSVWAYPYDCEDLITLLKADFKTGNDVLYIVADAIENDGHLKRLFKLK